MNSIQKKKSKVLTLYEDDLISKQDLSERLSKLNDEKERVEKRLTPLEELIRNSSIETVSYKLVKQVMQNFVSAYKESLTREQRKRLLHLLIHKITIGKDRKVDTIQIKLNKEVAIHFTYKGGENSSITDEFSPPFSILFEL